jgi:hypothetical protein
MAGLPVGCFSAAPCRLTTTISAGRTRLVRTGPETIGIGGGVVYFKLSSATRAALARRHPARLPVTVNVRDSSGMAATSNIQLIPFVSSGPSSIHGAAQSGPLRIIGSTDFVANGHVGGLLAGCFAAAPCHASITMTAAGKTIARTRSQMLGVNELGYLFFTLTNAGHNLLLRNHTNRLGVRVRVTIAAIGAGSTTTTTTTTSAGSSGGGSTTSGSGATGVGTAPSPIAASSTVSAAINLVAFR